MSDEFRPNGKTAWEAGRVLLRDFIEKLIVPDTDCLYDQTLVTFFGTGG